MAPALETLSSARSGAAYNAHSYHTKVPPKAIAELIRRNLPGGGTVADSFCGSGTTGVAAALAETALGDGRYDVLLGDLSPYATFIAAALNSPPAPEAFERAARDALREATAEIGDLWTTRHHDGSRATVLHTVWSEVLRCPGCDHRRRFWDLAVDLEQGGIRRELSCDECGAGFAKNDARRVTEQVHDPFIGERIERPLREPVRIVYEAGGERHEKAPDGDDLQLIAAAARTAAPAACPKRLMMNRSGPWGDLYRSGYHQGISHVHHFYTWRSFVTVGHLWEAAARSAQPDAVRLLVSSYNLAHATLMSRIVFKRGAGKPVLTGYQTGALYISALPVEKNPLIGIERGKLRSVSKSFELTHSRRGKVETLTGSAADWSELDREVDYAFVDPPFGANIPYAEANFIAEAWLGEFTDQLREATMSVAQGKTGADYRELLGEGFAAMRSLLARDGRMTVMFHSATSEPWEAMTGALDDAGLAIDGVMLLDKRQGSFKQVRSDGAVQGDLLIDVRPRRRASPARRGAAPKDVGTWLSDALAGRGGELDNVAKRELFSTYVAERVAHGHSPDVSATSFYSEAKAVSERIGEAAEKVA